MLILWDDGEGNAGDWFVSKVTKRKANDVPVSFVDVGGKEADQKEQNMNCNKLYLWRYCNQEEIVYAQINNQINPLRIVFNDPISFSSIDGKKLEFCYDTHSIVAVSCVLRWSILILPHLNTEYVCDICYILNRLIILMI